MGRMFDKIIKGKTGYYQDLPENRKLGRVGQKYKKDPQETVSSADYGDLTVEDAAKILQYEESRRRRKEQIAKLAELDQDVVAENIKERRRQNDAKLRANYKEFLIKNGVENISIRNQDDADRLILSLVEKRDEVYENYSTAAFHYRNTIEDGLAKKAYDWFSIKLSDIEATINKKVDKYEVRKLIPGKYLLPVGIPYLDQYNDVQSTDPEKHQPGMNDITFVHSGFQKLDPYRVPGFNYHQSGTSALNGVGTLNLKEVDEDVKDYLSRLRLYEASGQMFQTRLSPFMIEREIFSSLEKDPLQSIANGFITHDVETDVWYYTRLTKSYRVKNKKLSHDWHANTIKLSESPYGYEKPITHINPKERVSIEKGSEDSLEAKLDKLIQIHNENNVTQGMIDHHLSQKRINKVEIKNLQYKLLKRRQAERALKKLGYDTNRNKIQ